MSNYCKVALEHPLHRHYHNTEYGFPITGEAELFERLVMEIFQAGLSWLLVLKKREALNLSFENFHFENGIFETGHFVIRKSFNHKKSKKN